MLAEARPLADPVTATPALPAAAATDPVAPPPVDLERAGRLVVEPVVPEVVEPLLASARRDLEETARDQGWPAPPSLLADLVGWYGQGVARLTNLVILQRFSSFHLVRNPLWRPRTAAPGDAPTGAPRTVLDAYVEWEAIERLLQDDGPYPELARLLTTWRRNWRESVGELFDRCLLHREEIAVLLGCAPAEMGSLAGARFGISDPHGGGRTAAILRFDAGEVVYKPRSIDGEVAWDALAGRVLPAALGLEVHSMATVTGDGYGYLQLVPHGPCPDATAVARCYRRYGGLLALAHALGTIDLHHENVIVCGEHPVVVDAEPLFRARLALSEQGESRIAFERNLSLEGLDTRESVLDLGVLPMTFRSPLPADGVGEAEPREVDIGALTAYGLEPMPDLLPCGRGSDQLQMRPVTVVARTFPNLPHLDGSPCLPADHAADVVAGFEAVHRWLVEHRDELARPGGPLRALSRARVRFLVRPTMHYANLLARSLSPEPLRSTGGRRRRLAEDLETLGAHRFDAVATLVDREVDDLLAGDVPRFELRADEPACGEAPLFEPPLEATLARLRGLDDEDRRLQMVTVRERLRGREQALVRKVPRGTDAAALEEHAVAVVDALVDAALDRDDAPTWLYTAYAPGFNTTMVHTDRESLYEGAAGTAVVVAEAGRAAGRPDWCRLAARVFAPLVAQGGAPEPASVARGGGLARGLGGLLYALLRVGEAAGAPELLDAAVRLAVEYGPPLAAADGLDEVLNGRAGLLLAVLALHRRRPGAGLRDLADHLAGELLRRARRDEHGTSWRPDGARGGMANVSHGTSGVAMALARYARLRDHAAAAAAALEALRFDDLAWDDDERGWCDTRGLTDEDGPRTNWSWCNGRAGGLLARRAVGEALGVPVGESGRRAATAEPEGVLEEVSPGLCCGTPGVMDALLRLEGPAPAVEQGIRLLAGSSLASHYSPLNATLFTGTAGLAFALLRAARPDRVRSLLWFG